jgi:hypothetical protein
VDVNEQRKINKEGLQYEITGTSKKAHKGKGSHQEGRKTRE